MGHDASIVGVEVEGGEPDDLAGPERLLYGSDYPHNIGDMPGCAERITQLDVPEREKELIRSGNARRLFGL